MNTHRLTLQPLAANHTDALHALWTLPEVRRYLWDDEIIPLEMVQSIIAESMAAAARNEYGLWMAFEKGREELIGFTGFWPFFDPPQIQLIYGLVPGVWGKGYATEMGKAMIDYGVERHGYSEIIAATDPPNKASVHVMERLGMVFWKREGETIFYRTV